jgi:hypothetical protein
VHFRRTPTSILDTPHGYGTRHLCVLETSIYIQEELRDATIHTNRQPPVYRLRFLFIPRGVERGMDKWLLAAVSAEMQSGSEVCVARYRLSLAYVDAVIY